MDISEVKATLLETRAAILDWHKAQDTANAYRQMLAYPRGSMYSSFSGGTSRQRDNPMESAMCKLADYSAKADTLRRKAIAAQRKAERLIALCEDKEQRGVLKRRYIACQKWEDIAFCMGIDERQVRRLNGYGMKNISEKLLQKGLTVSAYLCYN